MEAILNSVPGRVMRKFLEDDAPNWAALIGWNALFAMFPIVLFTASLLGYSLRLFGTANDQVYKVIFSALPGDPNTQGNLLDAVSKVKAQSGILFVAGLIGLLWGGSALFGVMEQGFAVIYHTRPRDFIRQKLIAFGMVLLFTVLAGVAVATSVLLPAIKNIPDMPAFLYKGPAAGITQAILGIAAGFLLFLTIYYVIPNRKQEFHKVLPGAVVGAILFEAITLLFPLYITVNQSFNQYGKTFGLLFVLMTFFFFVGLITMVGVEINSVVYPVPVQLPGKNGHAVVPPESGPEAEQRPASARRTGTVRRGIPARAALGMAVLASLVGVLLGRRSTGAS